MTEITFPQAVDSARTLAVHAASTAAKFGVSAVPEISFADPETLEEGVRSVIETIDGAYLHDGVWLEWHGGPQDGARVYQEALVSWPHTTQNGNRYWPSLRLKVAA